MNTPITFRDVDPSAAVQEHVQARAGELQAEVRAVTSCRVTVSKTNKRHQHGDVFQVQVEVHVPQTVLIAERTSGATDDLYATIDAAFEDLRTRLHAHFERARERRSEA